MMTPLDIQTVKFSNSTLGYKKSEVDSFFSEVLTNYEFLYRTAKESEEKIKSLSKMVESYKGMEETMKNTLLVAQQSAEQLTKSARAEADSIVGEANQKSREIIAKATEVLAEEFEIEATEITPDASLKDTLGLDSLDLVDVVVLVEQHFGVTLSAPDFIGVVTFENFYDLLDRKING